MAKKLPNKKTQKKKAPQKKAKKKSASNNFQSQKWLMAFGVFAFTFLLYVNTIGHGYVLDDDLVCNKNRFVQNGFAGLGDIFTHSWYAGFTGAADRYYRPMMLVGFAIENSMFGNESSVYHSMNIFYYALGCAWLFMVMRMLFKDRPYWFPLTIALLFAAHPLHTEVVANIKSRDEIFAFLGLLGVIYGLIKYTRKNNVGYFALALMSYFFAILSKEAALAILGVIPLVLYFFTENSFQKIAVQTSTFLVLVAIYFGIRMNIIDPNPNAFETIDNSLNAIDNGSTQLSTAIGMLGKYLGLLFFPHPLSFDYSYNQIPAIGWGHWKVWTTLAAYGGLIYLAIKGLKDKHPISFGIFLFGLTFAITSNIVFLIGATFAERFMFVPLLGFCIVITYLIYEYLPQFIGNNRQVLFGITGLILLLYSIKTFTRNPVWESDETLFETGIYTAPNSSRAQSFYGVMHYRKALVSKDANEKKQLLNTSVEYLKKSIQTYPGFTETYQHLAATYEAQNQNQLAIQTYQNGLKTNPQYYPAYTNMGILFYKMKNYQQAISNLKNALNFAPSNAPTNRALGLAYKDSGQPQLAVEHFKKALDTQPNNVVYLRDMVDIYRFHLNDIETAIFYDKKVKQITGE